MQLTITDSEKETKRGREKLRNSDRNLENWG